MSNVLNRMAIFAKDPSNKNLVDMGTDLAKQYLFENENQHGEFNRYGGFVQEDQDGKKLTYADKNRRFHKELINSCYKFANIGEADRDTYSVMQCMQFDSFRTRLFSIVSIIIDNLMSRSEVENYLPYAEVMNVGWGDTPTFHIGSRANYTIAKISRNKNRASLEEHYNEDITLTPEAHQANISVDFYSLVRGDVNWGQQIARITKSFLTDISQTAANTMFGAFSSLATPWKVNAYTQSNFTELAERVAAANNVSDAIVYGTKTALGKVIPANQYFAMQNGSEYLGVGYIQSPFGVPVVLLPQAVKPESDFDFVLPSNKLLFLPNLGDKPVKVAMEGETQIVEASENDNAGKNRAYSVTMYYDIQIATGTIYGIMQIA